MQGLQEDIKLCKQSNGVLRGENSELTKKVEALETDKKNAAHAELALKTERDLALNNLAAAIRRFGRLFLTMVPENHDVFELPASFLTAISRGEVQVESSDLSLVEVSDHQSWKVSARIESSVRSLSTETRHIKSSTSLLVLELHVLLHSYDEPRFSTFGLVQTISDYLPTC
jgi:hypothetical protein